MTDEFAFLEARGFGPPEIGFHFRGNYVAYRSKTCGFSVSWDPEDTDHLRATIRYPPATGRITIDDSGSSIDLDSILGGGYPSRGPSQDVLARDPAAAVIHRWLRGVGLNREQITEVIRFWAHGLQDRADELLK